MAEVLPPFYTSTHHRSPSPADSSSYLTSPLPLPSLGPSPRSMLHLASPTPSQDLPLRSHASSPSLSSRSSMSDLSNLVSTASGSSSIGSSLADKYGNDADYDDDDDFPHYGSFGTSQDADTSDDRAETTSTDTTASDSPLPTPTVVDDIDMRQQPSQHVDYLSHDWKEEDVWSSWRHIVSQRKVYGQQSRLENAAWRTWVKNKYHLRTVSPETLNWLKESDVTWLYGPLKEAHSHPVSQLESTPKCGLSKSNSFVNKKPILKKRSMSEAMLQRSISSSSLVKQAAASVQAQGRNARRSILDRRESDVIGSGLASQPPSREGSHSAASTTSSGTRTPSIEAKERKHIRFDDKVEQCIAVEAKPEEYDDDEEEEAADRAAAAAYEEEDNKSASSLSSGSSDEGLVMMKTKPHRPGLSRRASSRGSRSSSHNGRKIIETLPATTLKYRTDSPDVCEAEQQQQQSALPRSAWGARHLSPSASQETLRPARPSRNFLLGTDDDDDDDDDDDEPDGKRVDGVREEGGIWSFGSSNPRSSLGASAAAGSSTSSSSSSRRELAGYDVQRGSFDEHSSGDGSRQSYSLQDEPAAYGMEGMRRTESGMFMPYEEDEDDVIAAGLFGRISETVNTARDIAHVIWNVGWRK